MRLRADQACSLCGALVADPSLHRVWHLDLGELDDAVETVDERGEGLTNKLYERRVLK